MKSTNLKFKTLMLAGGQSLFEVVIAVAMSSIIVTAIVALASNSIQNSSYSRDKTVASSYVQETLEWLKRERSQNPEDFRDHAINTSGVDIVYCFKSLSWPANSGSCSSSSTIANKFTREVTFPACDSACSGEIVEVNIDVSWLDSKGSHIVSSSTKISGI